jgi:hypothetical protein
MGVLRNPSCGGCGRFSRVGPAFFGCEDGGNGGYGDYYDQRKADDRTNFLAHFSSLLFFYPFFAFRRATVLGTWTRSGAFFGLRVVSLQVILDSFLLM